MHQWTVPAIAAPTGQIPKISGTLFDADEDAAQTLTGAAGELKPCSQVRMVFFRRLQQYMSAAPVIKPTRNPTRSRAKIEPDTLALPRRSSLPEHRWICTRKQQFVF
jgi:hypothetical protein